MRESILPSILYQLLLFTSRSSCHTSRDRLLHSVTRTMLLRLIGTNMRSCVHKSSNGVTTNPLQNEQRVPERTIPLPASTFQTSRLPVPCRTFTSTCQKIDLNFSEKISKQELCLHHHFTLLDKVRSYQSCRTLVSKRDFVRPALDARDLQITGSSSSATLLEMKKLLRQKSVDFTESHACLIINLPKHAISQNLNRKSVFPQAKSHEQQLEESLTKVYINKLTSRFVCPDEAIFGDWPNLRAFLLAWQKQKFAKKGEFCDPVPPLGHSLNLDQV